MSVLNASVFEWSLDSTWYHHGDTKACKSHPAAAERVHRMVTYREGKFQSGCVVWYTGFYPMKLSRPSPPLPLLPSPPFSISNLLLPPTPSLRHSLSPHSDPVKGLSQISITVHSGVVFLDILKPNETRGWHAKVGRCRPVERDSLRPLLPSLLPSPLLPSLSPSLLPIPLFHPPPSLFPTFLWVEQWSGHVLNTKNFVSNLTFEISVCKGAKFKP